MLWISSGTLDILPHNGAVVTLLAICGSTHRESYFDIVMVGIVGSLLALVAVILIGGTFGSLACGQRLQLNERSTNEKASDLLVQALENEGVDRIFGVPGEEISMSSSRYGLRE